MSEIEEIISALTDEIKAVKQKYRRHPITIEHLKISNVGGEYFYEGMVGSLEEDDMLSIPEGVPVKIFYKEYERISRTWISYSRDGKLLFYDSSKHHVILSIAGSVIGFDEKNKFYTVQPTVEELLLALQKRLEEYTFYKTTFGSQILSNQYMPSLYSYQASQYLGKILNTSQQISVEKIFENNISFLWGPPGTGKTTTLAAIIHEIRLIGKKVLAVSVSNIAVDQIALKLVSQPIYPQLKNCEAVRFGYARLQKVRDQDILFPGREHIIRLRKEIKELENKKLHATEPVLKAKYLNDISQRQQEIKRATIEPLFHAKVVLTTATQVCLLEEFKKIDFDVLLIDEASMMSIAMVIFLSTIPKEKLIITGDYRQLQPIAFSKSRLSYKWLHNDVFGLAGISKGETHPLLSMLNVQHRMTEEICAIISKAFYFGKLQTNIPDSNRLGASYPPKPGKSIVFESLTPKDGNLVQKTKNHSRYNISTSQKVMQLVDKIVRKPGNIEIGIITPYTAQAKLLRKTIAERIKKEVNPKYRAIKTGTVHSFQGDESDMIIFDVVDNSIDGPGRLFRDKAGERLINVAVSRAKGKLIIVGDPDLFRNRELEYKNIAAIYNFIVKHDGGNP